MSGKHDQRAVPGIDIRCMSQGACTTHDPYRAVLTHVTSSNYMGSHIDYYMVLSVSENSLFTIAIIYIRKPVRLDGLDHREVLFVLRFTRTPSTPQSIHAFVGSKFREATRTQKRWRSSNWPAGASSNDNESTSHSVSSATQCAGLRVMRASRISSSR
jgi:hypothetical protein